MKKNPYRILFSLMITMAWHSIATAQTSPSEKKTDSVARAVLKLFNAKQTDSAYTFAGENFRKSIDAAKWKSILETNFYPLLPFPEPVFLGREAAVNIYKLNNINFFISLDEKGKFEAFLFKPADEKKPETAVTDNPLKTHLDSLVHRVVSSYIQIKGNVAASAGIYYKGKTYFYNYGETKLDNKQLPNNKTLYEIGSITKTYTATLLAMAVNERKVTLDMPVNKFLPDSVAGNPYLKNILLKHIANHTSDLPRMPPNIDASVLASDHPYENYDIKHLYTFLKSYKATQLPGTKYDYSNLAFGLLTAILENIYKQPYEKLVAKYITEPAGLKNTKITLQPADMALVAQGYKENNSPSPMWKFKIFAGAGALVSNTEDMVLYGNLQFNKAGTILSNAVKLTHTITFKDNTSVVGLGWHYLPGKNILVHQGGTGGYRTGICIDPDKKITVTVLTNNASTGGSLAPLIIEALAAEK